MPTWYYFARPSHLAFHDFTKTKHPPKNLRSLLGLGMKFIPTPRYSNKWTTIDTMPRFSRNIYLRFYFATNNNNLPDENEGEYNPKMYVPSKWTPPHWMFPKRIIDERLSLFSEHLEKLFRKRRGTINLLPHQRRALSHIQKQRDFLIVPCDKNLGPSIIETEDYLRIAFRDHLNDHRTYRKLRPNEATVIHQQIKLALEDWIKKYKKQCTKMERLFLRDNLASNSSPFARFYLTLKAHKLKPGENVDHLKSRPIVSCPGSLLYPLGTWVDRHLQTLSVQQPSSFKNSFELRQMLLQLHLPVTAKLFTADAVSMYTNIPTNIALSTITRMLYSYQRRSDSTYPADAVIAGLRLVMRNNVFTIGDCTFRQLNGTAMGTPPAPPYATLYYAAHEVGLLQRWSHRLLLYKRFIDDVFGIWITDPDPTTNAAEWTAFQTDMNSAQGLTWEYSNLTQRVDFMDLTIYIQNNHIVTTLYEKPLNLHLYNPPHSAHPPGVLRGIIFGTIFRIFTLCSVDSDREQRTRTFFQRLIARGYKAENLRTIFYSAMCRAKDYTGPQATRDTSKMKSSVILHLPFHPNDPPSYEVQKAWKMFVNEPQYKMPLKNMRNKNKVPCGIERMIIAYKRSMNLGEKLSHRNLDNTGPPVSSYFQD